MRRRKILAGVLATVVGGISRYTFAQGVPRLAINDPSKRSNTMSKSSRPLLGIAAPGDEHWVGDGFWVSTLFQPSIDPAVLSPFVLLDHGAPKTYSPSNKRRGVGEHPHRGFETVTFAYQGEIDHRDSGGGGGTIGAGGVQWMTAGAGVVHEEFHSKEFSKTGGTFEMAQLWVNLPAANKMTPPRYQSLKNEDFPSFSSGDAKLRLIAGEYLGKKGPASTHSPMTLLDIEFSQTGTIGLELPADYNVLLIPTRGQFALKDGTIVPHRHVGLFPAQTSTEVFENIQLEAEAGTKILLLCGQPLGEAVVAHGPFVMNTPEEINEAIRDYRAGKMGTLTVQEGH